jgi:hypothetical protein
LLTNWLDSLTSSVTYGGEYVTQVWWEPPILQSPPVVTIAGLAGTAIISIQWWFRHSLPPSRGLPTTVLFTDIALLLGSLVLWSLHLKMPAIKRVSFSVDEKIALRKQHALNPQLSQQGFCKWFEESFGKPIRQATVSEVLSSRYSHLDLLQITPAQASVKKQRPQAYPDLEDNINIVMNNARTTPFPVMEVICIRRMAWIKHGQNTIWLTTVLQAKRSVWSLLKGTILHCTQSKEASQIPTPQAGRSQQRDLCVLGLALTIKFKIQVQLLKSAIQELSRYVEYSFGCEALVSLKQLL